MKDLKVQFPFESKHIPTFDVLLLFSVSKVFIKYFCLNPKIIFLLQFSQPMKLFSLRPHRRVENILPESEGYNISFCSKRKRPGVLAGCAAYARMNEHGVAGRREKENGVRKRERVGDSGDGGGGERRTRKSDGRIGRKQERGASVRDGGARSKVWQKSQMSLDLLVRQLL